MLAKVEENEHVLCAGGNAGFYPPSHHSTFIYCKNGAVPLKSSLPEGICHSSPRGVHLDHFLLLRLQDSALLWSTFWAAPITEHGRGTRAWPFLANTGLLEQVIFALGAAVQFVWDLVKFTWWSELCPPSQPCLLFLSSLTDLILPQAFCTPNFISVCIPDGPLHMHI